MEGAQEYLRHRHLIALTQAEAHLLAGSRRVGSAVWGVNPLVRNGCALGMRLNADASAESLLASIRAAKAAPVRILWEVVQRPPHRTWFESVHGHPLGRFDGLDPETPPEPLATRRVS